MFPLPLGSEQRSNHPGQSVGGEDPSLKADLRATDSHAKTQRWTKIRRTFNTMGIWMTPAMDVGAALTALSTSANGATLPATAAARQPCDSGSRTE